MLRYVAERRPTAGLSYTSSYALHFLSARMINRMPVARQVSSLRKNDVIRCVLRVEADSHGPDSNRRHAIRQIANTIRAPDTGDIRLAIHEFFKASIGRFAQSI